MPLDSIADGKFPRTEQNQTHLQAGFLHSQVSCQIDLAFDGRAFTDVSTNPALPPTFGSFSFPERVVIGADQIQFCISQFKKTVLDLVQLNRSPFIHHESYQWSPPVVYQDLLGITAMYCQKSPQNENVIFSMIESRFNVLIESSRCSTWSSREYLVGVQALIMYQIIGLFDGDLRQRANAERQLGIFEEWTLQLSLATNACSSGLDNSSDYQNWIFAESVRRTVLMSMMVQAIYTLCRDGYCTSVPLMASLPLSLNDGLWNTSEKIWWQTTLGFGGELVTYGDFTRNWGVGAAVQTDTFGTILLAACRHRIR